MSNNNYPAKTPLENEIVSTEGTPLPEQPKVPVTTMPRPISMANLIYQWQPMGYRVVLNLPFVGDDSSFLFYIRNGPFIPKPGVQYSDVATPEVPTNIYKGKVTDFALNNMSAVYLFSDKFREYPNYSESTKDFVLTLTQYSNPPPIATIAQCIRRS